MDALYLLAAKALNGGLLVVAFALVGEVLRPKRFAGLFGAAPSVAIANLAVIALGEGAAVASQSGQGMIVGALGMVGACLVGVPAVAKLGALKGSIVIWAAWVALASLGLLIW